LLYWGSGGKPIRVRELAPDRLRFLEASAAKALVFPDAKKPYRSLIEGAWVTHRDGYYYLFYSGDRCCDRDPRYAVMVARSPDAFGPFEELEAPILEGAAKWAAPGHNSIIADGGGGEWMLYHAIDTAPMHARPASEAHPRVMLLDRIAYRDGWPRIVPGNASAPRPAAR
jgi:arabinan endo-1,5-alpha-L-arabinosidase